MGDPFAGLMTELHDLAIARELFPIWTSWGVKDESSAIHSLGVTYLTTIGQRLGFVCCREYPVVSDQVRADSVWWDRSTKSPVAVFECERYKDGSELKAKVRNLLKAYHHLDRQPKLLCLIFWTGVFYPLNQVDVSDLRRIFERGDKDEYHRQISPANPSILRIFECSHDVSRREFLKLKSIRSRRQR